MDVITTATFLLRALRAEGIGHCFLVPGGTIDPFLSAMVRDDLAPNPVLATHEAGAVYMADGYARCTARPGVAMGIGGPGLANAVAGLAAAAADRIPLLYVCGEVAKAKYYQGAFQDSRAVGYDDLKILESVTTRALRTSFPRGVESALYYLLSHCTALSQGPTGLTVPVDVQEQEMDADYEPIIGYSRQQRMRLRDEAGLAKAVRVLSKVDLRRIAFLVGSGVGDASAVHALATSFGIPVATDLSAKGRIPEDSDVSLGVCGYGCQPIAEAALLEGQVDVLFVLGARMDERTTWRWSRRFAPRTIIQFGSNLDDVSVNFGPDVFVQALPSLGIRELLSRPVLMTPLHREARSRRERLAVLKSENPNTVDSFLGEAIVALRAAIDRPVTLTVDSGAHRVFAARYFVCRRNDRYLTSTTTAPMGWAIAASIGAALAHPDRPVVCITGDGCSLMHGLEISTAVRYKLKVLFLILKNRAYGNPQLRAILDGQAEVAGLMELPSVNYVGLGKSLGAKGTSVTTVVALMRVVRKFLSSSQDGPFVLELECPNEPTPLIGF